MRQSCNLTAALAALLISSAGTPAWAGLVGTFWGPAWVAASASSEYAFSSTGLSVVDTDEPPILVLQTPADTGFVGGSPQSVTAMSLLDMSLFPGGTAGPKDEASGSSLVSYTVATGSDADRYLFSFGGSVSNVASFFTPTKQADRATVHLTGLVHFEISQNSGDRTGFWFGDIVGRLNFEPLRSADPYESYSLTVMENRSAPSARTLLTQLPGDGGSSLDLYFGNHYDIQLNYEMTVPAGIDPPFTLLVGGSISAVPEPTGALLLLGGLAVLAGLRRIPGCRCRLRMAAPGGSGPSSTAR